MILFTYAQRTEMGYISYVDLKLCFFHNFFMSVFFQVIIRGSHIIVSRLSIDVDVQILTNPSLNTEQSSKARYQVLLIKLGMIKQFSIEFRK